MPVNFNKVTRSYSGTEAPLSDGRKAVPRFSPSYTHEERQALWTSVAEENANKAWARAHPHLKGKASPEDEEDECTSKGCCSGRGCSVMGGKHRKRKHKTRKAKARRRRTQRSS
jgi:hypothetical protein